MRAEHTKKEEFWTKIYEKINSNEGNIVMLQPALELNQQNLFDERAKTPPAVEEYLRRHDHILSINVLKEVCLSFHDDDESYEEKNKINRLKKELTREIQRIKQIRAGKAKRKSNGITFLGKKVLLQQPQDVDLIDFTERPKRRYAHQDIHNVSALSAMSEGDDQSSTTDNIDLPTPNFPSSEHFTAEEIYERQAIIDSNIRDLLADDNFFTVDDTYADNR
ncbi:hypothetical protein RFI_30056 [Reticulomyxa filosa]|uniref:Uncharacterized protein n=1 Tax=Reticulomyxa filosa TaxID=46433 RepID=X6M2W0_RETFI|nr:hypothetical protein RFI_30056 [Reticulomyxa filosa]|eukprot:ETO07340.1 hypothetical protein RFI_30056 [Reticulomyxa filosa]